MQWKLIRKILVNLREISQKDIKTIGQEVVEDDIDTEPKYHLTDYLLIAKESIF